MTGMGDTVHAAAGANLGDRDPNPDGLKTEAEGDSA